MRNITYYILVSNLVSNVSILFYYRKNDSEISFKRRRLEN